MTASSAKRTVNEVGWDGRGDQAADERAEPDPEVHHDPLHPEGDVTAGRAASGRRAASTAPARRSRCRRRSRSRRRTPARVRARRDRRRSRPRGGRARSRARAGRRPGRRAGPTSGPATRATAAFVAITSPATRERDPAHVVEVDEREREHDPVPERVAEPAELEGLDGARQAAVEAAQPADHRGTVAAWTGSSTPA